MSPRALIGIRGALTASPLPHHRTFASRIRRFGSLSIITYTKTFSSGSPPPLQSPHLRTGMWSHRPEDTSLYYRSGLPSTHAEIPCLSLTPRAPSDRIAPLLVVCQSSFSERDPNSPYRESRSCLSAARAKRPNARSAPCPGYVLLVNHVRSKSSVNSRGPASASFCHSFMQRSAKPASIPSFTYSDTL